MARRTSSALLLEVGCEELPPAAVPPALAQLAADATTALRDAQLASGLPSTTGTVRRLVLMVDDVASRQADRVTRVRGPAARIAFDPEGNPTQAALGFARSQGVPVAELRVEEMDGGRYAVAEVREAGRPAAEVLRQILPRIVAGLSFPKTMRWTADGFRFGRPIRWVTALLGGQVLPLEVAGLQAGRRTVGHRFLAPRPVAVATASAYPSVVRRLHVVLDPHARRNRILAGATTLAAQAGGEPVVDPNLLDELVWSTEHPTPLLGTFDPSLAAALPREIVLVTLQHHQKCFGVQERSGRLLPAFIAVRDGGASHLATVRTGHEWVVRARLEDAVFFLAEDRRTTAEQRRAELMRLAHVAGLGSMADHVARIECVSAWLADAVDLDAPDRKILARAAMLCKGDLVSALVREFPELQGTIGRIYAVEAGEAKAVAVAIEQHYWPKAAGGALPASLPGALLAITDRALLLAGAFLAGLEPTGSQDPYGLRRAGSAIVAIMAGQAIGVGIRGLLARAAEEFDHPADARARAVASCVDFTLQRLRAMLTDQNVAYDTVDAVVATGGDVVMDIVARARALQNVRAGDVMPRLATAFARASRILSQGQEAVAVDPALFEKPAEGDLYVVLRAVGDDLTRIRPGAHPAQRQSVGTLQARYAAELRALERLGEPIDRFFDDVLVMAPDLAVRANRLALLRAVTSLFLGIADFSRLAG